MESEHEPQEVSREEVFKLNFEVRTEVEKYEDAELRSKYVELRGQGKSEESLVAYRAFMKDVEGKLESEFSGVADDEVSQALQFRQTILVELASAFALRDAGAEDDANETLDSVWDNLENYLSAEIPQREYFEELKRQVSQL